MSVQGAAIRVQLAASPPLFDSPAAGVGIENVQGLEPLFESVCHVFVDDGGDL